MQSWKWLAMAASLGAGSLAAAAPLEPLGGPYAPCVPCNTQSPPPKSDTGIDKGFSLRLRPIAGYYSSSGEYSATLGNIHVTGTAAVRDLRNVSCQQLQQFQQTLQKQFPKLQLPPPVNCNFVSASVSASGPMLGAEFGADYSYGHWKFSLDLDYANVSTNSSAQGQFVNTGMIPTVHYAVSPKWDLYGGYQQRWKGTGAFNDSYYSERGELVGVQYSGFHITPKWRAKLGGSFNLSSISFAGATRQLFDPAKIPPVVTNENVPGLPVLYIMNVPSISSSGKGYQLNLQIDSPKSPHSVGINFRQVFTDTGQGSFHSIFLLTVPEFPTQTIKFDGTTTMSGSFSEYYAQLYYQYTFGKR